jgi:hypothetical protein
MDYTVNRNRAAIWRLRCRDRKALPTGGYSHTLARLMAAHAPGLGHAPRGMISDALWPLCAQAVRITVR